MAPSIVHALRQVKEDLAGVLSRERIERVCREAGYRWRQRVLDPFVTIHLFILQVLEGNTACSHLPHLSGVSFTSSAYCQARARLPLEVFRRLVDEVEHEVAGVASEVRRWHGHRTFLADGSGVSMPDTTPLQAHFGQPAGQRPGCGFPVAHLLAMFDWGSGMIRRVVASPLRTHDMADVRKMHAQLSAGDLLLGDRAFCSFVHFALLVLANLHGLFRMHQRQIVDFRPHRRCVRNKKDRGKPRSRWLYRLGVCDQVVEWLKPLQRPKWMTAEEFAAMPDKIVMRELRYRVGRRGFRTRQVTLATTLLDAERYPAEDLAELYGQRWQAEVNLRHLKQTLGMNVLKCKNVDGVMKEIQMFALVYNLVRAVILQAARRHGVIADRISFIDALRWLRDGPRDATLALLIVNPRRPDRLEPRVRKRRPKEFPLMKEPRQKLRKRLRSQRHAA